MTDDTAIAELAKLISESVGISIERGWIKDLASAIHAAGWRRPPDERIKQISAALVEAGARALCCGDYCRMKGRFDSGAAYCLRSDSLSDARAVLEAAAVPAVPDVSAIERERCAKIAENPGFIQAQDTEWDEGVNFAKRFIAAAIRAQPAPPKAS